MMIKDKKLLIIVVGTVLLFLLSILSPNKYLIQTGDDLESLVRPKEGLVLAAVWGDLGRQLVRTGIIDEAKFTDLYVQRGEPVDEITRLLQIKTTEPIRITRDNAGHWLNLFWALGLANQNPILTTGQMVDPRYGSPASFASVGGWTLGSGQPMDHYGQHRLINLTAEQQTLVETVSQGVYRPCCGNATHFPDCNHGLAMLGLLQLSAAQGANETELWQTALAANSYWFPETYLTIATYLQTQDIAWPEVDPKSVLGNDYSSAKGFARVSALVAPVQAGNGGCAV